MLLSLLLRLALAEGVAEAAAATPARHGRVHHGAQEHPPHQQLLALRRGRCWDVGRAGADAAAPAWRPESGAQARSAALRAACDKGAGGSREGGITTTRICEPAAWSVVIPPSQVAIASWRCVPEPCRCRTCQGVASGPLTRLLLRIRLSLGSLGCALFLVGRLVGTQHCGVACLWLSGCLQIRLYKVQQLRAAARSQWPEFC
jgi:hypothetical protein